MTVLSDRYLIEPMTSMQALDFTGELKNINTPTLVLSGGADPLLHKTWTITDAYPIPACRCSLGQHMRSTFVKPKLSLKLSTSLCSMDR